MAGDDISLEVGDEAQNVNAGKRNTQNTQRAGDNYFGGQPGSDLMQVWIRLSEHGQQINDLIRQMDDLPNRVRQLEKTEVIIRPGPEVIIRPVQESMSVKTLSQILIAALIIVILLIGYLVYWTVTNAS